MASISHKVNTIHVILIESGFLVDSSVLPVNTPSSDRSDEGARSVDTSITTDKIASVSLSNVISIKTLPSEMHL